MKAVQIQKQNKNGAESSSSEKTNINGARSILTSQQSNLQIEKEPFQEIIGT